MGSAFIPFLDHLPNEYSSVDDSNNGCAHAAVTSLVRYYDRQDIYPEAITNTDLLVALYRNHPPDSRDAFFGSTPGHLHNILKKFGFHTWRRFGAEHARRDLERSIKAGVPMVVLIDMGKFDPVDNFVGHYVVVFGFDDEKVHVRNMLPDTIDWIRWDLFLSAWHCWFLNQLPNPLIGIGDWQYAGIAVSMSKEQILRASSRRTRLIITPAETENLPEVVSGLQPSPRLMQLSTRLAKRNVQPRRMSRFTPPVRPPRGAATLAKTLTSVSAAGGIVTIDGEDVTSASDGATRLATLPREVVKQLREKLGDSLREARLRRELADNPLVPTPAEMHFTVNVDTADEWVDVEWRK